MLALTCYSLACGMFFCGLLVFVLTDCEESIADLSLRWRVLGCVLCAPLWPAWLSMAVLVGSVILAFQVRTLLLRLSKCE